MTEPLTDPSAASTPRFTAGQPVRPREVHVIINPAAGQEKPVLGALNRIFKENGVKWEAFITKDAGDAQRYARDSAAAGADVVMACGGDGTVREAASGLRGSGVPLGIIPCGTANVMSLELAIAAEVEQAIAMVAGGRNVLRAVDMGLANDSEFLLRVGIGMEAKMILETPREAKNRWGNLAYALNGISQLANPEVAHYTLNLDGLRVEVEGITLYVANSVNLGVPGLELIPGVNIGDGLLDVVLIRRSDLPALLAIASNALLDLPQPPEPVLHWQVREVTVEANAPQPAEADGDDLGQTPITARVLPKAVLIACPEEGS